MRESRLAFCYEDASNTWGLNLKRQVTESFCLRLRTLSAGKEKDLPVVVMRKVARGLP